MATYLTTKPVLVHGEVPFKGSSSVFSKASPNAASLQVSAAFYLCTHPFQLVQQGKSHPMKQLMELLLLLHDFLVFFVPRHILLRHGYRLVHHDLEREWLCEFCLTRGKDSEQGGKVADPGHIDDRRGLVDSADGDWLVGEENGRLLHQEVLMLVLMVPSTIGYHAVTNAAFATVFRMGSSKLDVTR